MRMIVFTTVALMAMTVAYTVGLPAAVAAVVFLFVLVNGILDRWAQPLLERLRA